METKTECSEFHKNSRFSYNEPQKKNPWTPDLHSRIVDLIFT